MRAGFVFALCILTIAACTSSRRGGTRGPAVDSGAVRDTGSSPVGDTGPGGPPPAVCVSSCSRAASAACPAFDSAMCQSDCASLAGVAAMAGCTVVYDSAMACAATGTFSCDVDGTTRLNGCDAQSMALIACLTAGGP